MHVYYIFLEQNFDYKNDEGALMFGFAAQKFIAQSFIKYNFVLWHKNDEFKDRRKDFHVECINHYER